MNKPITRLFFAGDFCSTPSVDQLYVAAELKKIISSCDLKILNFEVPLKPNTVDLSSQKRKRYYQNDDTPLFLRDLGFNLFSIANNHIFDWGVEGFKKTKAILGEGAFGAGTYEDAYKVKIVEVNGLKIGFLALSFAAYTGVFDDVTKHEGFACAYINDLHVNHVILNAKNEVDYLFVLPHDGIEYIDIPTPEIIARYRDFVDYGADGVIGTHPHCPQGWEEYKGRPIFYSLGNFLFNSKEGYDYRATNRLHWYEGLCVVISIDGNGINWEVVNTRNVDNLHLQLDNEKERIQYNESLCQALMNPAIYKKRLDDFARIAICHEVPIVDHSFHDYGLTVTVRQLIKYVFRYLFNRPRGNNAELSYLLKNDTRRRMMERYL